MRFAETLASRKLRLFLYFTQFVQTLQREQLFAVSAQDAHLSASIFEFWEIRETLCEALSAGQRGPKCSCLSYLRDECGFDVRSTAHFQDSAANVLMGSKSGFLTVGVRMNTIIPIMALSCVCPLDMRIERLLEYPVALYVG